MRGLIDGGVGSDPARDDLRHAQRQGRHRRDRERVRREGRAPAADDFVHHHRQERPHAVGADARGVLHLGPPRAGRSASASTARSARATCGPYLADLAADRRVLRHQLPERRPAERLRPVRRAARRDRRAGEGLRHQRLRQHRRRLLRHDARSHQGDRRRRSPGIPPRAAARTSRHPSRRSSPDSSR